jgi:hypothetical protein
LKIEDNLNFLKMEGGPQLFKTMQQCDQNK